MKDEIKEILDNQKLINVENDYERIIFEYLANNCSEFDDEHIKQLVNLKVEQYKKLLDYITNLQEENKVLLEKYSTIQILYNSSKLKNEKAIEYVKNLKNYRFEFTFDNVDKHEIVGCTHNFVKDLLNILQGGDEE